MERRDHPPRRRPQRRPRLPRLRRTAQWRYSDHLLSAGQRRREDLPPLDPLEPLTDFRIGTMPDVYGTWCRHCPPSWRDRRTCFHSRHTFHGMSFFIFVFSDEFPKIIQCPCVVQSHIPKFIRMKQIAKTFQ